MAGYETVHFLSKKSEQLRRNTFFFVDWPNGGLVGGLNQAMTPVNSTLLHRWALLLDPRVKKFELIPIKLEKCGIFSYDKIPTGPAIPEESIAPLPSGDYLWYNRPPDGALGNIFGLGSGIPFNHVGDGKSFAVLMGLAQGPHPMGTNLYLSSYEFPSMLVDSVTRRDNRRCSITGSSSDKAKLIISWIYPPPLCLYSLMGGLTTAYHRQPEALRTPSNALLIREDLAQAFLDLQDDYRLVVFRSIGDAEDALLQHIGTQPYFRQQLQQGPGEIFLREHFRTCLLIHLLGGDIHEDYPLHDILAAMKELGLTNDSEDDMPPFDDERWKTDLGKEILEDYFK